MRMLILTITLMANFVMGVELSFDLCKNDEECPTALRSLTDTCALLVAEVGDNKIEGKVCVDSIFCGERVDMWTDGKE